MAVLYLASGKFVDDVESGVQATRVGGVRRSRKKLSLCGTFPLAEKNRSPRCLAPLYRVHTTTTCFLPRRRGVGGTPISHIPSARGFLQILIKFLHFVPLYVVNFPYFYHPSKKIPFAWFVRLANRFFRKSHDLPDARDPVLLPTHAPYLFILRIWPGSGGPGNVSFNYGEIIWVIAIPSGPSKARCYLSGAHAARNPRHLY